MYTERSGRPRIYDENINKVSLIVHKSLHVVQIKSDFESKSNTYLVRALLPDDKQKMIDFYNFISEKREQDETFIFCFVFFFDDATFHLSGKVHHYSVRI